jgi:hypothetical protein
MREAVLPNQLGLALRTFRELSASRVAVLQCRQFLFPFAWR